MSTRTLADSHLRLAGWLSFLSAIITLPLFVLALISIEDRGSGMALVSTLLLILHTGIYCYVYLTFRDYLHAHFSFSVVDRQINMIVGVSVAAAVLHVLSYMFGDARDILAVITFLLLIPLGVVSIQMGLSLFKLRDTMSGLRNTYSYLLIFMGVFLLSVILIIPGLFIGLVLDVILGIILLRAASDVRK